MSIKREKFVLVLAAGLLVGCQGAPPSTPDEQASCHSLVVELPTEFVGEYQLDVEEAGATARTFSCPGAHDGIECTPTEIQFTGDAEAIRFRAADSATEAVFVGVPAYSPTACEPVIDQAVQTFESSDTTGLASTPAQPSDAQCDVDAESKTECSYPEERDDDSSPGERIEDALGRLDSEALIANGFSGARNEVVRLSFFSNVAPCIVRCTGTQLSKRYVATAAHCFDPGTSGCDLGLTNNTIEDATVIVQRFNGSSYVSSCDPCTAAVRARGSGSDAAKDYALVQLNSNPTSWYTGRFFSGSLPNVSPPDHRIYGYGTANTQSFTTGTFQSNSWNNGILQLFSVVHDTEFGDSGTGIGWNELASFSPITFRYLTHSGLSGQAGASVVGPRYKDNYFTFYLWSLSAPFDHVLTYNTYSVNGYPYRRYKDSAP